LQLFDLNSLFFFSDVIGPNSAGKDDAVSEAKCPAGEVAVGCACAPLKECGGIYLADDTCKAFHRWGFSHKHINASLQHFRLFKTNE
jgi:hypothetical protein